MRCPKGPAHPATSRSTDIQSATKRSMPKRSRAMRRPAQGNQAIEHLAGLARQNRRCVGGKGIEIERTAAGRQLRRRFIDQGADAVPAHDRQPVERGQADTQPARPA